MKAKRAISVFLASALTAASLAGCSGGGSAASSAAAGAASASASSSDSYAAHETISIAFWNIGQNIDASKEDAIRDYVYKKFNLEITPVNTTWGDYRNQINTWAASDSLPDIFCDDVIKESTFTKWVKDEVVQALPDDLSKYPNLKKYLSNAAAQEYKYPLNAKDGKYYCIPRATCQTLTQTAMNYGMLLRRDWMEKVGVTQVPTNMTDFISLMQKFVNNDPDGNGKADTIGCAAYSADWLSYLMMSYEPSIHTWCLDTDGKTWIPGFMTANAEKGIQALQDLYQAGGLDRDFATLSGTQGWEKFTTGVAGAYVHALDPGTVNSVYTDLKKKYGQDFDFANNIVLVKPFQSADGNYYRNMETKFYSETYINSKCDQEKVSRFLAFYDWALSDEGWNMIHYGIKDTDYTVESGKITPIQQKDSDGSTLLIEKKYPFVAPSLFYWSGIFSYESPYINSEVSKSCNELVTWYKQNSKPVPTNLALDFISYDSKSKATFSLKDEIVKAILSDNAAAEWKQMVANYKENGYNDCIRDLNQQAQTLGITSVTVPDD